MRPSEPTPPRPSFVDELVLALAMLVLTVGLWRFIGFGALIAPGLVLLWIALPQRAPFLSSTPVDAPKRRPS